MKYLVLAAKPYEFSSKDGNLIKGVSVSYIQKKPSSRANEFGHPPFIINSQSLDGFSKEDFKQIPAIFDMEFEQVTGKDHKPALVLTGMEFVAPIDLASFFS
jgi:hypothetical protein